MYWMHWKSEKNRNEPNELNELKYSKSLNQLCSLTCSCICMLRHVSKHLFIPFKIKKKDWAKWAKWARILKNTLTDVQLCSLTYFLVFAYSDTYQNIYLIIPFKSLQELFSYKSLIEIFQQAKNKFNSSILTHHNPITSRIARNLVLEQQWVYPFYVFLNC